MHVEARRVFLGVFADPVLRVVVVEDGQRQARGLPRAAGRQVAQRRTRLLHRGRYWVGGTVGLGLFFIGFLLFTFQDDKISF